MNACVSALLVLVIASASLTNAGPDVSNETLTNAGIDSADANSAEFDCVIPMSTRGFSPLCKAVVNNQLEVINMIRHLAGKETVKRDRCAGILPWYLAAAMGHVDVLINFFPNGTKWEWGTSEKVPVCTGLHYAARYGQVETLKYMYTTSTTKPVSPKNHTVLDLLEYALKNNLYNPKFVYDAKLNYISYAL